MSKNVAVEMGSVDKNKKEVAKNKSTSNTASKKREAALSKENKRLLEEKEALEERLVRLEGLILNENSSESEVESLEIRAEEYIKVVSLCPFRLNLSTDAGGKGKRYSFDAFGQEKMIPYGKLVEIMETNSSFLESGFFYIMDSRVIRLHGLDETYEKLLTQEKIEEVLACKGDAVALYDSANKRQKEMIVSMFISKVRDDENSVDFNVISQISRLSKIDIAEKANEARLEIEEDSKNKK